MAKHKFGDPQNLESSEEKSVEETEPSSPPEPPKNLESPKETATETEATAPVQSVALRVFANGSGHKADQMAGFVYYATKNKLGPMSMTAWHAELAKFSATPVK